MGSTSGWRAMRESGFRMMFTGVFSLAIAFVIYSRLSGTSGESHVQAYQLTSLAYAILGATAASLATSMYGAYTIFRAEQARTAGGSSSLVSFITGAFSDRKYWRIMGVAAIGYGIFFGLLSQILVYRPDISFTERGIAAIPSTDLVPCCGAPGYLPMFTVYFTDHFLLLVIPVNVILAVVVSVMVGFNVALSVYAYRLRQSVQDGGRRRTTSIVGGIGAATGLFVGCPTCAGSMISAVFGLGAIGAGASASVLAPFQTAFIAASLPALALAPFLLARSIRSISMCGAR